MSLIPRQRRPEARILRLWPFGFVLVVTLLAAVLVAAAVFCTAWGLLGVKSLKPEAELSSKTLFDLVKFSFGVVAAAGALVALIVAYRRQRVNETDAVREATRLHTERFTQAVSQLGEESPAVRLGGVHALAGLADDAPTRDLRQTCIDVLCAYLRLPYIAEGDLPEHDAQARNSFIALREVRHTIVRIVRDRLRLAEDDPHSWQGHHFDFTGVVFDGGDFTGAVFSGGETSFIDAVFSGGEVSFVRASFSGGRVTFAGAVFSGGKVNFREAVFSGGATDFNETTYSGATVSFYHAVFSGGTVGFGLAKFASGTVDLRARFSGSTVWFGGEFSGSTVFLNGVFSGGKVKFGNVMFRGGGVTFFFAEFSGAEVHFTSSKFSGGEVYFGNAIFSGGEVNFSSDFDGGEVYFERAVFSGGKVNFTRSGFYGGTVNFGDTTFSGGTVNFQDCRGAAPESLVPTDGQALPEGLTLPSEWLQSAAERQPGTT